MKTVYRFTAEDKALARQMTASVAGLWACDPAVLLDTRRRDAPGEDYLLRARAMLGGAMYEMSRYGTPSIARLLGVPRSTAGDWVRLHKTYTDEGYMRLWAAITLPVSK